MAFYPIISKYDINFEDLILNLPKTYSTEKEAIDFKVGKNIIIKRKYTSYGINYKYDRVGPEQFCLMTQFLKIATPLIEVKGQVHFCVDINENTKLKALIFGVFEYLKTEILKIKPNLSPSNIVLPITQKITISNTDNKTGQHTYVDKEYLNITLTQFNKKVTTPIHYHRTKKQGGNVVTIVNKPTTEIFTELKKEMELFKYSSYGKPRVPKLEEGKKIVKEKENVEDDKPKPVMYYEGKFTLFFTIEHLESNVGDDEKHEYCKINIFAKEAETKYNLSKVKSALDVDVSILNRVNTKQPDILII